MSDADFRRPEGRDRARLEDAVRQDWATGFGDGFFRGSDCSSSLLIQESEVAPLLSMRTSLRTLCVEESKKAHDLETHQSRKSDQWRFGMRANFGVDASPDVIPVHVATLFKTNDLHVLLQGEDRQSFWDTGYKGVEKRKMNLGAAGTRHVVLSPGQRRSSPLPELNRLLEWIEKQKASARAKVEHAFSALENFLLLGEAPQRGAAKNFARVYTLIGLANLLIAKRRGGALALTGAF